MFGRLSTYHCVQDEFQARPVGNAGLEPVLQAALGPSVPGTFLRVACVVAIIWGGSALAVWTAG